MNIKRQSPQMGSIMATLAASATELFSPKGGRVVETPGTPAAINMTVVTVLALTALGVVMLKKRGLV